MATLLLTSTREISEALAPQIEELGHKALVMPLLEVTYFDYISGAEPPSAILITSRHALKAAEQHLGTPLYVVGQQTANLALAKGHHIELVAMNIDYLKDKLPSNTLYLRGRDVAQELNLPSYICYAANHVPADTILPEHDGVILLSARIAAKLSSTSTPIFCLSQRIADALPQKMQTQVIIARRPTVGELLDKIKDWSGK